MPKRTERACDSLPMVVHHSVRPDLEKDTHMRSHHLLSVVALILIGCSHSTAAIEHHEQTPQEVLADLEADVEAARLLFRGPFEKYKAASKHFQRALEMDSGPEKEAAIAKLTPTVEATYSEKEAAWLIFKAAQLRLDEANVTAARKQLWRKKR